VFFLLTANELAMVSLREKSNGLFRREPKIAKVQEFSSGKFRRNEL